MAKSLLSLLFVALWVLNTILSIVTAASLACDDNWQV
jgi:hypothetical protein